MPSISNVAGHKVNMPKFNSFSVYKKTNRNKLGTIPFTVASKYKIYLRVNLTKAIKQFYISHTYSLCIYIHVKTLGMY